MIFGGSFCSSLLFSIFVLFFFCEFDGWTNLVWRNETERINRTSFSLLKPWTESSRLIKSRFLPYVDFRKLSYRMHFLNLKSRMESRISNNLFSLFFFYLLSTSSCLLHWIFLYVFVNYFRQLFFFYFNIEILSARTRTFITTFITYSNKNNNNIINSIIHIKFIRSDKVGKKKKSQSFEIRHEASFEFIRTWIIIFFFLYKPA